MTHFSTIKEAKDFLANRIAAEAASENVPLSDVERKMLYWSEIDWTLPDMKQVGAEFDRDYDQNEYEQKIARLIANITVDHRHHNEGEEEKWDAAVAKLSEGDDYLSVLVGNLSSSGLLSFLTSDKPLVRPPHDFLKLPFTALAIIFGLFALFALDHHFFPDGFWQTVGSHIDQRAAPLLLLLLIAGYFLAPKLWQLIRSRSNRA